jgi:predicted O-methyltransferase YrrM
MELENLLSEIEAKGIENDSEVSDRSHKQLNITKDTGEFLTLLVKASCSEKILEVGTSNGYSTLWLAAATSKIGKITTLEVQQHKIDQAQVNFDRSGLGGKIEIVKSDASEFFEKTDKQFDLIFLDAERTEYMKFSNEVVSSLRIGGLLVCDNAISHKEEMAEFIDFIKNSNLFSTSLVPVGKGEFVAYKNA